MMDNPQAKWIPGRAIQVGYYWIDGIPEVVQVKSTIDGMYVRGFDGSQIKWKDYPYALVGPVVPQIKARSSRLPENKIKIPPGLF
jgi:hypothetical protein